MKNYPQILMVVCLLKLLSWSSPVNSQQLTVNSDQLTTDTPSIQNPLPCLDSSKECVEELTQRAIANSAKLKTLGERIALIDRRLGVSKDSIDYANSKLWTNYLPSSTSFGGSVLDIINPFAWIKNLAGGGEMQRDRIAIADLEVNRSNKLNLLSYCPTEAEQPTKSRQTAAILTQSLPIPNLLGSPQSKNARSTLSA